MMSFCVSSDKQKWFGENGNFKGNSKGVSLKAYNSLKTTVIKMGLTLKAMVLRPFQIMRGAYNALRSPRSLFPNLKTKIARRYVHVDVRAHETQRWIKMV